jgi:hypothetical protein
MAINVTTPTMQGQLQLDIWRSWAAGEIDDATAQAAAEAVHAVCVERSRARTARYGSQSQRHEVEPSVNQQAHGAPHQTWRSLAELAEGIVTKAGKQLSSSPSIVPDEGPDWRDELTYCAENIDCFDECERDFVRSMARWRGQPSPKQRDWLAALADRVRGEL